MNRMTCALVTATMLLSVSMAHADTATDRWDGVGAGVVALAVVELTPPALLAVDAIAHPTSTTYGTVELVAGGAAALLNGYLAADSWRADCSSCRSDVPWFIGFAVVDVATAVHGGFVIAHGRDRKDQVVMTPAIVTSGRASAPGFAIGGSF